MTTAAQLRDERQAIAAWVALTAPGALVTCATLVLALLVAPTLTPRAMVPNSVRHAASGLLLLHAALTAVLALKPRQTWAARLFLGLLGFDALLCGGLAGTPQQALVPLLVCAVLVISLEVRGWVGGGMSLAGAAIGVTAALWHGITWTPLGAAPWSFPTVLNVETSFSGVEVATSPLQFTTALSVETWFAGGQALAAPHELFEPTLAVVLVALCAGLSTSLWRVRKARRAVAASIVAAARVTP